MRTNMHKKFTVIAAALILNTTIAEEAEVYGENMADAGKYVSDWLKELSKTISLQ